GEARGDQVRVWREVDIDRSGDHIDNDQWHATLAQKRAHQVQISASEQRVAGYFTKAAGDRLAIKQRLQFRYDRAQMVQEDAALAELFLQLKGVDVGESQLSGGSVRGSFHDRL